MKMHNRDEKMRCSAVILAGGQSRRMGRDKRFLTLDGESFIERLLKLASSFADEVLVSLAIEEQAERLPEGSFRVVLDENPGMGPAHALITAAKRASFEVLAVMPVDSPLLEPQLYRLLLREIPGYDAAVPVVGGFAEPLHAVYSTQALITKGEGKPKSMNHLLKLLNVNFVTGEKLRSAGIDTKNFLNVNTPRDYERLKDRVKKCR